jgi:hypothetical protein
MSERWYAGRRALSASGRGAARVERMPGQPGEGFADVGGVMAWLEKGGYIIAVEDREGTFFRGWGDPFCAVAASRNDPWEQPPQLRVVE